MRDWGCSLGLDQGVLSGVVAWSTVRGVSELPYYHSAWPKWPSPRTLALRVPTLCPQGLEVLSQMLTYQPSLRVTCSAALRADYFADVREGGAG